MTTKTEKPYHYASVVAAFERILAGVQAWSPGAVVTVFAHAALADEEAKTERAVRKLLADRKL